MKPCDYDSSEHYERLIGPLRDVAQRLGYALAVHGTLKRDIDLIACPWTRHAVTARTLAKAIQHKAREVAGYAEPGPLERYDDPRNGKWFRDGLRKFAGKDWGLITAKPHGRRGWTFHLTRTHDGPYIDLAVMPREPAKH